MRQPEHECECGCHILTTSPRFSRGHAARMPEIRAKIGIANRGHGRIAPQTVRIPSDSVKLAYLAGLIDGEGTIVRYSVRGIRRAKVAIYNSDEKMIQWIHSTFGGRTQTIPPRSNAHITARLPERQWGVDSYRNVWAILTAVEPFLITKKERAREAILLCKSRIDSVT